jgi:hypothetical protein
VHAGQLPLHHAGEAGRFAEVLVLLQIAQDEPEVAIVERHVGLEPDRVVLHRGDARLVLGLRLAEDVGLDPARGSLAAPARHRVHVDADEEVARRATGRAAIAQVDQRVAQARQPHLDAAPHQLGPHLPPDRQRDVLLRHALRQVAARVAGIPPAVSRVHHHIAAPSRSPDGGPLDGSLRLTGGQARLAARAATAAAESAAE